MKIYKPLAKTKITQGFTEDNACVRVEDGLAYTNDVISKKGKTCPVGYQSLYGYYGKDGHGAYDMSSYHRQPIYFPVDADTEWYVHEISNNEGAGLGLKIVSKDPVYLFPNPPYMGSEAGEQWAQQGAKCHVKLIFWHADRNLVAHGDKVVFGQRIQLADSTGASSGTHLHFAMKLCDKNGKTLSKDNGYLGAVDLMPYYKDEFVLDFLGERERLNNQQALRNALWTLTHAVDPTPAVRAVIQWLRIAKGKIGSLIK